MSVEPRPTACSRRGGAQGIGRAGSKEPDMALLEVRGANVRFGGHKAVRDVDLDVADGHVTGLIGTNGAGKTTPFNVINGLQETVSGAVLHDGEDRTDERRVGKGGTSTGRSRGGP